jgi:hypothetical protein
MRLIAFLSRIGSTLIVDPAADGSDFAPWETASRSHFDLINFPAL